MQDRAKTTTGIAPANRALRRKALMAALLSLLAAGPATHAADPAPPDAGASPFYVGADISTLSDVERRGGIYLDGDKPSDPLAIFMKHGWTDRKSTRLNSSHRCISYAAFFFKNMVRVWICWIPERSVRMFHMRSTVCQCPSWQNMRSLFFLGENSKRRSHSFLRWMILIS